MSADQPASCTHCRDESLRALTYDQELAGKASRLEQSLLDSGLRELFPDQIPATIPVVPAPAREGYRNTVKLVFGFDRQAGVAQLGIYRPGSHDLIDLEHCLDHHPAMQPVIAWVKAAVLRHSLPVYHEKKAKGFLRYFLLKVLPDGRMLCAFVTPHDEGEWQERLLMLAAELTAAFPELRSISQNINPDRGNRVLGNKSTHLEGQHSVPCHFLETPVPVGPYTFLQANLDVFREILLRMSSLVQESGGDELRVADLYCGCGAIGRSVTSRQPLLLLEGEFHSQLSMVEGAREDGREEITAVRGRIEETLVSVELFDPDLVIVDPPRKGLDPDLLKLLLELRPARILYLSCHPGNLWRDVRLLASAYVPSSLEAWDMIPATPHVECLAVLDLVS